jgi:hypothetical protein
MLAIAIKSDRVGEILIAGVSEASPLLAGNSMQKAPA